MIKKITLIFIFMILTSVCIAEDSSKPNGRPKRPNIPFKDIGWKRHGNVGFSPVIAWYPSGIMLDAGPVIVSPDRRYVRIGINMGFGQIIGVDTFNFYNGETKHFK